MKNCNRPLNEILEKCNVDAFLVDALCRLEAAIDRGVAEGTSNNDIIDISSILIAKLPKSKQVDVAKKILAAMAKNKNTTGNAQLKKHGACERFFSSFLPIKESKRSYLESSRPLPIIERDTKAELRKQLRGTDQIKARILENLVEIIVDSGENQDSISVEICIKEVISNPKESLAAILQNLAKDNLWRGWMEDLTKNVSLHLLDGLSSTQKQKVLTDLSNETPPSERSNLLQTLLNVP
jgi:hypothetical protein